MALRPTRLIRWALPVALLGLVGVAFALPVAGTTVTETRHFDSMHQACAGVSFLHCYGDMERAQRRYEVGQQLAICADGDGTEASWRWRWMKTRRTPVAMRRSQDPC